MSENWTTAEGRATAIRWMTLHGASLLIQHGLYQEAMFVTIAGLLLAALVSM